MSHDCHCACTDQERTSRDDATVSEEHISCITSGRCGIRLTGSWCEPESSNTTHNKTCLYRDLVQSNTIANLTGNLHSYFTDYAHRHNSVMMIWYSAMKISQCFPVLSRNKSVKHERNVIAGRAIANESVSDRTQSPLADAIIPNRFLDWKRRSLEHCT